MHSRYLKSIQKDVFLVRWVGSIMSWCNPEWEALSSILESSFVVLSFFTRALTSHENLQEQQLKGYLLKML